jgi:hypothetical protein
MRKLTSSAGHPFRFGLLALSLTSAALLSDTAFAQKYQETNLVSNASESGVTTVDPDLVNCWGISRSSTGTWWAADEGKGVAQAATDFGTFSHSIIVGQFGSGEILAFDPVTGAFEGKFEDQNGSIISMPGIWGLSFGAGNANSGGPNQLFFNAGVDQGKAGLFGFFAPVASDLTQGNDQ